MEVHSTYKNAKISAFKARDVAREIQGLPVSTALDILTFTPRKAAFLIGKTLKSAVANAENNHELVADQMVVKEATVGEGPTLRRFKARARGSAGPIRKRTSHIRIVLSDEIPLPEPKQKSKKPKGKASKPKAAPAPKVEEEELPADEELEATEAEAAPAAEEAAEAPAETQEEVAAEAAAEEPAAEAEESATDPEDKTDK